jgi:hypothetical protein
VMRHARKLRGAGGGVTQPDIPHLG